MPIIKLPRRLIRIVPKAVPLRTTLRIQAHFVVVHCHGRLVEDGVVEAAAGEGGVGGGVEGEVEGDAVAGADFVGGGGDASGGYEV